MPAIGETGRTDPQSPVPQICIMAGEWRCCSRPSILTTVLGSCVTVCLWDIRRAIGGMNHFVLPSDPRQPDNPRYGDVSLAALVSGLLELGARVADLRAKVFGGANVLPTNGAQTVGADNVRFALDFLRQLGTPVMAQRTGGICGQQLRFYTATGEARIRRLERKQALLF